MLVKYVVVNKSGNWFDQLDTREEAEKIAAQHPGLFVELWLFSILPDGTHGGPIKCKLKKD